MTEEVAAASTMPQCNGKVAPEKGPLQVMDEIGKSVPFSNVEASPETPPAKENQQEKRNSLVEGVAHGDVDGEKQCQGKVQGCLSFKCSERKALFWAAPSSSSPALRVAAGPGREGTPAASPGGDTAGTLAAGADGRGNAAEEEEEEEEEVEEELEEEEEDTEEDEVQVVELKKKGEVSRPEQSGSGKEPSPPASPGDNSPAEKPGEQPSPGKKNDISRHSYSRYNTISYRRIRKGNTKQRIDEFESMMHL
ncbi:ERMIN protein, partial [Rostratula benghalensis]|nr:ERMIN protein [Rostratula benghalensis]